jgi:hypothetical protein
MKKDNSRSWTRDASAGGHLSQGEREFQVGRVVQLSAAPSHPRSRCSPDSLGSFCCTWICRRELNGGLGYLGGRGLGAKRRERHSAQTEKTWGDSLHLTHKFSHTQMLMMMVLLP